MQNNLLYTTGATTVHQARLLPVGGPWHLPACGPRSPLPLPLPFFFLPPSPPLPSPTFRPILSRSSSYLTLSSVPLEVGPLNPGRGSGGVAVSSPAGSGEEPRTKLNLVHLSR